MKSSISRNIIVVMLMALGALVINAAIPVNALHQLNKSHIESELTREKIGVVDGVLQSLLDAQNSVRGYNITDNPEFLEPFYTARLRMEDQLKQLHRYSRHTPAERAYFLDLRKKSNAVLDYLHDQILVQRTRGSEAALAQIALGEGKHRMDEVRLAHEEIRELENTRLQSLEENERKIHLYTNLALIALTIFDLILFILAFTLLIKALKGARETERQLGVMHDETVKRGEALALKNKYKTIQARLNDVLQSVVSPEEAYAAIEKHCAHLFPGYTGALFIRSNSKDYFEFKAGWNHGAFREGFEPDDCWAARNNQSYEYDGDQDDLPCRHLKAADPETMHALCLPISSRDEMIGILSITGPDDDFGQSPIDIEAKKLAHEVVGQIGLAIANLRLRDNLRKSSIIDPLTGLFNRRYLDETLNREIARAERSKQQVSVIMLDIDHFKMFNDNYGHDAGDVVLREVGSLLKEACRTSDIPCRYGGEEFLLILPQADLETAVTRAEDIRWGVKKLHLSYGADNLPAITASLGVAAFPIHGSRFETVIKAADEALYVAKHQGRDRVVVASGVSDQKLS
ncbi:MAG TPA: diguanylate cyclase [Methylophilaceae bacterium]|nr:diguanylate cyclase [Methylophilaceae bacterium]